MLTHLGPSGNSIKRSTWPLLTILDKVATRELSFLRSNLVTFTRRGRPSWPATGRFWARILWRLMCQIYLISTNSYSNLKILALLKATTEIRRQDCEMQAPMARGEPNQIFETLSNLPTAGRTAARSTVNRRANPPTITRGVRDCKIQFYLLMVGPGTCMPSTTTLTTTYMR